MKSVFFVLFSVILTVIIAQAQPEIKFNTTSHNFGDVTEGSYPKTTFTFYNVGNQPLKLSDVRASCGCTSPSWPREDIAPGDSGKIDVVFNTHGYANRDFAKSVSVTSNDTKTPNMALYIAGHVIPKNAGPVQYPFVLSADHIDFSYIRFGKTAEKSITLTNNGDSAISIKNITISCNNCMTATALPLTLAPKESTVVTVVYNAASHEPRNFVETIRIFTSIPDNQSKILIEKGVSIYGEVLSKEMYKKIQQAQKQAQKEKENQIKK